MQSGTLISVEEYLHTSYSPDCEYVEGRVLERNLGEQDHRSLQMFLSGYLFTRRYQLGIRVYPEQRVQFKNDYLEFGVRYVWVVDPRSRRAQIYDASGVHDMKDGMLWTVDPEILVPFDQLFD